MNELKYDTSMDPISPFFDIRTWETPTTEPADEPATPSPGD